MTSPMGPIERELRDVAKWPMCRSNIYEFSGPAYNVVRDATFSLLGYENPFTAFSVGALPDVLSEAIEAASELGL